jgi:hypothetical protein
MYNYLRMVATTRIPSSDGFVAGGEVRLMTP